ncbi:MAG: right-handed parallel beta-helix repeat-containing protein, partial [Halobacteriota archaeon]
TGQYKTITDAVNAAQPGDTIQISPGTYTENVVVAKSLTITALRADSPPIVKAADQNKDVFRVQERDVHIEGLTITGASNASGVHVDHTSGCVVTRVVSYSNVRAVYLEGATNSEVRDSNLAGNGYGVYSDGASYNTIAGNVATHERGTKDALGDGIYMFYSNGTTITGNNCSANHIFGISMFKSSGNTVSKNVIRANEQIGMRLRDSENTTLTYNTISSNGQPGKVLDFPPAAASFGQLGILLASNNTRMYLNNFVNQSIPVSDNQNVLWSFPEKLTYTYNGATYEGYMGNYYSDYKGSDSNGTGIGSTPSTNGDTYPLMQPFENYELTGTPSPTTLPTSATSSPAQDISSSVAAVSMLPGLTMASLVFGTLGLSIGLSIGTPLVAAIGIAYVVSMLT